MIKYLSIITASLFIFISCNTDKSWSRVVYDKDFYDVFFDEHPSSYPWYIIKDDDGSFSSIFGNENIDVTDTILMYHTAKSITNHQGGYDEMDFCIAHKNGDTLFLHFPPALPAYWLALDVTIVGNKFKAEASGIPFQDIKLEWETIKQELVLQNNTTNVGDSIKGKFYIEFTEKIKGEQEKYPFYFSIVFKTVIEELS